MSVLNIHTICETLRGDPDLHSLNTAATLTVYAPTGNIVGYSFGDALTQQLERMFHQFMGPINAERVGRLKALLEQEAVAMDEVIQAIVDPLIAALKGPDARVVQFCHRHIFVNGANIDRSFWWTPTLFAVLRKHFVTHAPKRRHYRIVTITNTVLYRVVGDSIDSYDLPLEPPRLADYYDLLQRIVTSTLSFGLAGDPDPSKGG